MNKNNLINLTKFNIYITYCAISVFFYLLVYDIFLKKNGNSLFFTSYTIPFYLIIFFCDLIIYQSTQYNKKKISFYDFIFVSALGLSIIGIFLSISNKHFIFNNSKYPIINFLYSSNKTYNFSIISEYSLVLFCSIFFNIFFTFLITRLIKLETLPSIKTLDDREKYFFGLQFGNNIITRIFSSFKPALIEEIVFRHFILNFLINTLLRNNVFNHAYYAIIITNILFSLIHLNIVTNNYMKLLQTFILGIIFTMIYIKYGLEMAILSHGLSNITFLFIKKFQFPEVNQT